MLTTAEIRTLNRLLARANPTEVQLDLIIRLSRELGIVPASPRPRAQRLIEERLRPPPPPPPPPPPVYRRVIRGVWAVSDKVAVRFLTVAFASTPTATLISRAEATAIYALDYYSPDYLTLIEASWIDPRAYGRPRPTDWLPLLPGEESAL